MRKVKMLAAAVAILAVGGIAASSAQAAGTANVELVGVGDCDVSYASSAWGGTPPASTISSIVVAAGGSCDVDTVTGSGTLTRTTGTAATFAGAFHIETFFGLIECDYEGALGGTWATSGTKYSFDLAGSAEVQPGSSGACPDEPDLEMTGLVDQ